jgi:hypothetical protein
MTASNPPLSKTSGNASGQCTATAEGRPGRRRLPGGRERGAHARLVVVLVDVEQVVGAALEGQQLQGEARELDGDRV